MPDWGATRPGVHGVIEGVSEVQPSRRGFVLFFAFAHRASTALRAASDRCFFVVPVRLMRLSIPAFAPMMQVSFDHPFRVKLWPP